ncbi:MAG: host-nuclease inhibitor Gam family protein [Verrucomicrobia bacterium]|nr:host-nuclease inhibitor Gam family protein [Verrucomicrobiota bacterium]
MNLKITSPESLDTAVAAVVRKRIELTTLKAAKDTEVAAVEKQHQAGITKKEAEITLDEETILAFCAANRGGLFTDKKSRETSLAVFGFEMTPHRVETANKKIKWADVIKRAVKASWSKVYVRAKLSLDKDALLADRETLTPEKQTALGIQFCQDEQFFIRPKPETAAETPAQEAA